MKAITKRTLIVVFAERPRAFWQAIAQCVCSAIILSGCAVAIYGTGTHTASHSPSGDHNFGSDNGYCSSDWIVTNEWDVYTERTTLPSQSPYVAAEVVTTRTFCHNLIRPLLFNATPLGVLGPAFGYPHKEHMIAGTVTLRTEAHGILPKPFETAPGQATTLSFPFHEGLDRSLAETGRAVRYSPTSVDVTVVCSLSGCSVSASPDVVSPPGVVVLKAQTVTDEARLAAIEREQMEERIRAEKQGESKTATSTRPVDKRSYRSVIGAPPDDVALACDDPIVLQNALEYRRVGDYAHYDAFLGYGGGVRRCKTVQGGSVVFATDHGQGGYRQVRMKDYLGMVVQLWMREQDLARCADDGNPKECRPAATRANSIAQSCSQEALGFCLEGPTWRGINCLAYAMYGCATTKRDSKYCAVTSKTLAPHIDADKATIEKLTADCMAGKETTLGRILDKMEKKNNSGSR